MDKFKEEIRKALELQKEIYGDLLYTTRQKNISPEQEKEALTFKDPLPTSKEKFIVAEQKTISTGPAETITITEDISEEFRSAKTLSELNKIICNCLKCPLGKTRKNFVFGSGNINSDVLILGEGPGEKEDEAGLPFVGRSGDLLTDILAAIKFKRDEVYIANIVKCRPPGNRAPFSSEMEKCIPYLKKQIEIIDPKVILCLGLTAAQGLLRKKDTLTNLRGQIFEFEGRKVMVTYHPAALLRNPQWKRGCWEDVKAFRKLYDSVIK